eukprot:SM000002S05504  [mRNA]  locus=s2:265150:267773:+ [translate_table: standard]
MCLPPPLPFSSPVVIPTDEEVAVFKQSAIPVDTLTSSEQFLAAMAQVPRLRTKVQVMIFVRHFDAVVKDAMEALATVQQACKQVRGSALLRFILAACLAAGNELNAGTARGSALGVRLDSLSKLADLKVTSVSAVVVQPRKPSSVPAARPDSMKPQRGPAAPAPAADDSGGGGSDSEPRPGSVSGAVARATSFLEFVAAAMGEAALVAPGQELAAELEAVGAASRWTQGELVEALSSLERGMAAARDERAAALSGAAAAAAGGDTTEGHFALWLGDFLEAAEARQVELVDAAAACREAFQGLAIFLGEKADTTAPETMFGALWSFVLDFDKALRHVMPPPLLPPPPATAGTGAAPVAMVAT